MKDLDHLAARLHGRRSRLSDGARLRALCGLGSVPVLSKTLFPGEDIDGAAGLQARLAEGFILEAREISACLDEAGARFVEWQAARFQLENLKAALRGILSGAAPEDTRRLLASLRAAGEGYGPELASARDTEALLAVLPEGFFRRSLAAACASFHGSAALFFIEAALDRDYLKEMYGRTRGLGGSDRAFAAALCAQETGVFNLMLAARGKFFYGFENRALLELYVPGQAAGLRRFKNMLEAADAGQLRSMAAGLALDPGPMERDPSVLEALAWRRYARLANRALRRGHMGFAAVAAYLALRRVEIANLITVAEGLRLGVEGVSLFSRLIPRIGEAYV